MINRNIQIYITTFNRPEFILRSLNSVLFQTFRKIEVIISDNSTNYFTRDILTKVNFSGVKYIKREPSLSGIDHFNKILDEVTADYFMIFHDDDIMHPKMVEHLFLSFQRYENAVAIGTNAYLSYNGKKSNRCIFSSDSDLVLENIYDLAKQYLIRNGIVPFSSLMFRNKVSKYIRLSSENGENFCDAAFVMDASKLGSIVYLVKPLMDYHVHTNNRHVPDVSINNKKFIEYLKKNIESRDKQKLIEEYEDKATYMAFKQGILSRELVIFSRRYFKLLLALFKTSFTDYFVRSLVLTVITIFNISTNRIKVGNN